MHWAQNKVNNVMEADVVANNCRNIRTLDSLVYQNVALLFRCCGVNLKCAELMLIDILINPL